MRFPGLIRNIRTGLLVLALLVTGSGCSVKMLYNNMDRLMRWSASDYVDMNDAQREYFEAEIDSILYWHRENELPRYAAYLGSLETKLGEGTDALEVQGVFDTMFSWWDEIEARSMPMLIEIVLSLSDEQAAELPTRFGKDNKEFAEDEDDEPLEKVQETWAKEFAGIFSRFSGKLSREQKAYLAAQSVRYVPQFGLWAEYRRRWQHDLMVLVAEGRGDHEEFAEAFLALLAARESYYGEELTAVFAANKELGREVTAWMINHLTDKQHERFFSGLNELADDFYELAADLPDEVPAGGGCLVRC